MNTQQEHLDPHLPYLFLVGQLLLCSFGAGDAEFLNGCNSDKLPASLSHGEQQSCTAGTQWAAYIGQVSRNDRSVDGKILKWLFRVIKLWVAFWPSVMHFLHAFFIANGSGPNSWLPRGCFWERPHELQRWSGPDNPAADQCTCAETCGNVCAVIPTWTSAAPGCESWKGQGEWIMSSVKCGVA